MYLSSQNNFFSFYNVFLLKRRTCELSRSIVADTTATNLFNSFNLWKNIRLKPLLFYSIEGSLQLKALFLIKKIIWTQKSSFIVVTPLRFRLAWFRLFHRALKQTVYKFCICCTIIRSIKHNPNIQKKDKSLFFKLYEVLISCYKNKYCHQATEVRSVNY